MQTRRGPRRRFAAAIAACALALAGGACGGESDEDRVRATIEGLQRDFAERDVESVCAAMSGKPKQQIGSVGHGRKPTTCEHDLRAFYKGLRDSAELIGQKPPNLREIPKPEVVDVRFSGDRATARARVDGKPLDIPLVRQGDEWKLDDFFIVTGPVRPDLD